MMQIKNQNRSVFTLKRAHNAVRGIVVFITHDQGFILSLSFVAFILGWYLHLSSIEWALIVMNIGLVLAAEAFNTAIEIDIDLTSPEFHPYARDTKDVAAGSGFADFDYGYYRGINNLCTKDPYPDLTFILYLLL